VYPSHWAHGEYRVANPNADPYSIVLRSLHDFRNDVAGTGARVVPWLQDFSLGVAYGPAEVRAQIRAARDAGIPEFILWDPLVTYTAEALDRGARRPKSGQAPKPKPKPSSIAPTTARSGQRSRPRQSTRTSSARFPCSCTTRFARTAAATTT
jgi:hypothetical protein